MNQEEVNQGKHSQVPTMAEMAAKGQQPEVLFWVGCAGSYDQRYQKGNSGLCQDIE